MTNADQPDGVHDGPDRPTVITRQPAVLSKAMTRRTRITLTVSAAIVALALAGAGIGLVVSETGNTTAAAAAPTPSPNAIECANIDRAYQSWAIGRLSDAYEFEAVNEVSMKTEVDDQKELLEAVQGYDGQPSKELAVAVARFGSELALLNAELVIGNGVSADQSAVVAAEHRKVRQSYASWKAATCG